MSINTDSGYQWRYFVASVKLQHDQQLATTSFIYYYSPNYTAEEQRLMLNKLQECGAIQVLEAVPSNGFNSGGVVIDHYDETFFDILSINYTEEPVTINPSFQNKVKHKSRYWKLDSSSKPPILSFKGKIIYRFIKPTHYKYLLFKTLWEHQFEFVPFSELGNNLSNDFFEKNKRFKRNKTIRQTLSRMRNEFEHKHLDLIIDIDESRAILRPLDLFML